MSSPRVSVIMSVYNEDRYLKQAVDSILSQTFEDFEFIIINDGSTDGTQGILETYSDDRLRIIEQKNLGLTRSLNNGLKLSAGEYIARMDGNDISVPERLEYQVTCLNENKNVGLVGTFVDHIDENGQFIKQYTYKTKNDDIKTNLWVDCPFCHSSAMLRKECIEKAGFYREKVGPAEDLDLWFRISENFEVANIPKSLHKVRIEGQGVSVDRKFDQLRYSSLVRRLANERATTESDSLDLMTDKEIELTLESLLPRTRANEKMVICSNYIYLAEVCYCTGDYRCSAQWLRKSVVLQPFSQRAWVLTLKLILCTLLSSDKINHIKRIYRRNVESLANLGKIL